MNLVLIGFMGVGKTSVGKALARRLRWPFIDTDELIEELYRMPVAAIFARHGEASFRETEKEVVRGVAERERCVIATGGGVVLDRENVDRLRRHGLLVHLTLPTETIFRRIGRLKGRPLLATADPRQTLEALYHSRERLYAASCRFTIDRNGLGVEETADSILAAARPYGIGA